MYKIIVEVGSTCTKVDKFDGIIQKSQMELQYNLRNITIKTNA